MLKVINNRRMMIVVRYYAMRDRSRIWISEGGGRASFCARGGAWGGVSPDSPRVNNNNNNNNNLICIAPVCGTVC